MKKKWEKTNFKNCNSEMHRCRKMRSLVSKRKTMTNSKVILNKQAVILKMIPMQRLGMTLIPILRVSVKRLSVNF